MLRLWLERNPPTLKTLASSAAISQHIRILQYAGFMPIVKMRVLQKFVRELQDEISYEVVERMHAIEERDCFEFAGADCS